MKAIKKIGEWEHKVAKKPRVEKEPRSNRGDPKLVAIRMSLRWATAPK